MEFKIHHSLTGRVETVAIDEQMLGGGRKVPLSPQTTLSPVSTRSGVSGGPSSAVIDFIKHKVAKPLSVSPSMQLLLVSPSGSQLNMQTLQRDLILSLTKTHDLFLYDKRLLSEQPLSESLKVYDDPDEPSMPSEWPVPPDDSSAESTDSILDALVRRSRWATLLIEDSNSFIQAIRLKAQQSHSIAQAASTAVAHLQQYQTRLAELASQRQQQIRLVERDIAASANCTSASRLLAELSCADEDTDLEEQIVTQHYKAAVERAEMAANSMQKLLEYLDSQPDVVPGSPADSFEPELATIRGNEKTLVSLGTEVKLLANSLQKDALRCRPSNCVQIYQEQNSELIPALLAACHELRSSGESISTSKLHCQERLLVILRNISRIQTRYVHVRQELKVQGQTLGEADSQRAAAAKALDKVFLYGAVIVESNRRRQFQHTVDQIQAQGGSLDDYERIEAAQEQEANRIKKWQAHYEPFGVDSSKLNTTIIPETYLVRLQEAGLDSIQQELQQEYEMSLESLRLALDSASLHMRDVSPESIEGSRKEQASIKEPNGPAKEPSPPEPTESAASVSSVDDKAVLIEELKAQISAQAAEISNLKAQAEKNSVLKDRTRDVAQRLYASTFQLERILQAVGLVCDRGPDNFSVTMAKTRSSTSSSVIDPGEAASDQRRRSSVLLSELDAPDLTAQGGLLDWVSQPGNEELFKHYNDTVLMDYDAVRDAVCRRLKDVERIARKYYGETRVLRDGNRRLEHQLRSRLALDGFCAGDLVLFLPTRELGPSPVQANKNHWAAFNVGSPHYFLAPDLAARIHDRDFLIARVISVESHVVGGEDENPFELPAGTEWHSILAKWRDSVPGTNSRSEPTELTNTTAGNLSLGSDH